MGMALRICIQLFYQHKVVTTPSCAFQAILRIGGVQVLSTTLDPTSGTATCIELGLLLVNQACLSLVDVVVTNGTASGSFGVELKPPIGPAWTSPSLLSFVDNECVASCVTVRL